MQRGWEGGKSGADEGKEAETKEREEEKETQALWRQRPPGFQSLAATA